VNQVDFSLHDYIEMYGQQNIKLSVICLPDINHVVFPRQILIEVPYIKFYEMPPSNTRTVGC